VIGINAVITIHTPGYIDRCTITYEKKYTCTSICVDVNTSKSIIMCHGCVGISKMHIHMVL